MTGPETRISSRPDRVLIFATAFEPAVKAGGPVRAISNLVEEISSDMDVVVVAPDRDLDDTTPFPGLSGLTVDRGPARVTYVDTTNMLRLARVFAALRRQDFDLVILNSIWNRPMALLPSALLSVGLLHARTVALMPRGELEVAALSHKSRRKRALAPLVKAIHGRSIDVFGATSMSELWNLQKTFDKPVLLTADSSDRIPFGFTGDAAGPMKVLFLGRVVPHKGLLPLLKALVCTHSELQVNVAGPIEDERYWQACRDLAVELPPRITTTYLGTVARERVPELLHEHDLLVTLTAGENFGHTIAESLQAGCSVVATDKTPWSDVLRRGGGWIVENRDDSAAIADILDDVCAMTAEQRIALRHRARDAFAVWEGVQPDNIAIQALGWRRGRSGAESQPSRTRP